MKPEMKFYSVVMKKAFKTDNYTLENDKNGRTRLIAEDPKGNKSFRYISKDDLAKFK